MLQDLHLLLHSDYLDFKCRHWLWVPQPVDVYLEVFPNISSKLTIYQAKGLSLVVLDHLFLKA